MQSLLGHDYFMNIALKEAAKAAHSGEIPVGCVICVDDHVIAKTHNQTQLLNDVTAHAEILAITAASSYLDSKYLHECTMYITLEPCIMCAGALRWSQIGRLVYGASDNKNGFMSIGKELLHPRTVLEYGVRQEQCGEMLTDFFKKIRK